MFYITSEPLDVLDLEKKFKYLETGALITFSGIVRNNNEGKEVSYLEYEAYKGLAEKEGLKIIQEAKNKCGTLGLYIQDYYKTARL